MEKEEKPKQPILETRMLIKPSLGIELVTTYFDDGTVEEREVPSYLPIKLLVPITYL